MKRIIPGVIVAVLVCIIPSIMMLELFTANRESVATPDEPVATYDEPVATQDEAIIVVTEPIEITIVPEESKEATVAVEIEKEETEPTEPKKEIIKKNKNKKSSSTKKPTSEIATPDTPVKDSSERVYLGKFTLTAYCNCKKCCGKWSGGPTAIGKMPKEGRTIAVDPKVIPLGSKISINGKTYTAEDTGSAIKNKKIDIYFDSHSEAWNFGKQKAKVYLVK